MRLQPRVIIADDNPEVRAMLQEALEPLGVDVTEADSGRALLDAALAAVPDLIITDIQMPGGSGVQALALLRQDPRYKDIPVIVLTGLERADFPAFLDERNAWVFKKPADLKALAERVAVLLRPEGSPPPAEPPPAEAAVPAEAAANPLRGPLTRPPVVVHRGVVLLVDDDPALLAAYTELLKDRGYQVFIALDGEQAFAQAGALKPDIIVMDIQLGPKATGVKAAQWLRANEALKGIPVILLTGMPPESVKPLLPPKLDLTWLMYKPPNWPALLDLVDRAVAMGRRARNP